MSFWQRVFCCMSEEDMDVGENTRLLPKENVPRENQDNEIPFILYSHGVLSDNIHLAELPKSFCREGIKKIACGREHFLMLTETGHVLTGGSNTFGQCGEPPSAENVNIIELNIKQSRFSDIATGSYHSILLAGAVGTLFNVGTAKCYTFGHELGAGFPDKRHRHVPTELVLDESGLETPVSVFANYFHSAVITSTGRVFTWGEIMTGTKKRKVQLLNLEMLNDKPVKLDFGQKHSLLLSDKGLLYSWGDNTYGELGLPQKFVTTPTRISEIDTKVIDIAAGGRHSMALDENGTLFTFGDNSEGQCAANTARVEQPQIVTTTGLLGESSIRLRYVFASDSQSAFITSTGEVFAWGDNSAGKIGISGSPSVESPTIVEPLMGRATCGFGLGGFFSVAVTGPPKYSMISKNSNMLKAKTFAGLLLKKTLEKSRT